MSLCGSHFCRLQNEILQLKQKICEVDSIQRGHCGTLEGKDASSVLLSSADKSHLATLMDSRYSTLN
jgi:kinesin family protein 16B